MAENNSPNYQEEPESYERVDTYNSDKTTSLANHYEHIIEELGEDVNREGLVKTPERVAKAMQFLTHGYDIDPTKILKGAMFKEEHNHMVLVKDIEIYSMCEHHMLSLIHI